MSVEHLSPRLQALVQDTRALLEHALAQYQDVVYSNSLGAEAMVLTDIIASYVPEIEMFTLDTGRLHDETLALLDRLERRDPMQALDDGNLRDYCTALEGVSHFHYLMWSLPRGRDVSLLELELQAEVDKYASAVALLTQQGEGRFPRALHARLFSAVSFLPQLDAACRHRYEEANRHAARFCRSLEERFLQRRRSRPEAWLKELRRFFRCGHQEKIRQLAV